MKLALGTVQFGLPYGIANQHGRVTAHEAGTIVEYARFQGMDTLDTAFSYGDSEARLGVIGVQGWRVVSKVPPVPPDTVDVNRWLRQIVETSLSRLKVSRLGGLLLHRSSDYLGTHGEALFRTMCELQSTGQVEKIGVSIYDPTELDALAGRFRLQLVQAPYNVFDRRLETSGWLERLVGVGTEVHVRSVFLQGLLLINPSERPRKFRRWASHWGKWDAYLADTHQTSLQAAIRFVTSQSAVSRVVVGVDCRSQLEQIIGALGDTVGVPAELQSDDLQLIDPSKWSELNVGK